mgnify:CR=1 FL=1
MKQEYIKGLGDVQFTKRKQSKRITVRYDPEGKIKVSLPQRVSYKTARRYLVSNKQQISDKIADLRVDQFHNDLSEYNTRWHQVELLRQDRHHISYQIHKGKILIKIPDHLDPCDQLVQKVIRQALENALRLEAKAYLPQRLNELANRHQLPFNNLYLKKAQTLWGSCSSRNNINLNIHLMRLPDHLIDYVLTHELCHTIHKNHGPQFWTHLQYLMKTDVKKLRTELNQYSPKIY